MNTKSLAIAFALGLGCTAFSEGLGDASFQKDVLHLLQASPALIKCLEAFDIKDEGHGLMTWHADGAGKCGIPFTFLARPKGSKKDYNLFLVIDWARGICQTASTFQFSFLGGGFDQNGLGLVFFPRPTTKTSTENEKLRQLRRWMSETVFPEINIEDVPFHDAISQVQKETSKHSPDGRSFTAVFKGSAKESLAVGSQFSHATLPYVLDNICSLSGIKWGLAKMPSPLNQPRPINLRQCRRTT